MNKLLLSLLLLANSIAKADCSGNGIGVWPQGPTIKANSIFVLDFYSASQPVAAELNTKYAIYLKAGSKRVKLQIIEICKGEFLLTQVVLKPAAKLQPGTEYELVIDSLPAWDNVHKWNASKQSFEPIKWTVLKEVDTKPPQWLTAPAYASKSITHFGCGPARSVVFDASFSDESPLLVRAEVTHLTTGKKTAYYIPAETGRIRVGHGMCAGAFFISEDGEYEAIFSLMDGGGNKSGSSTAIKFTAPVDELE